MTIKAKLFLLSAISIVMLLVLGFYGLYNENKAQNRVEQNFNSRIQPAEWSADSIRGINRIVIQVQLALQHDPQGTAAAALHLDHSINKHLDAVAQNLDLLKEVNAKLAAVNHRSPEANQIRQALLAQEQDLIDNGVHPIVEALKAGNFDQARTILVKTIVPGLSKFGTAATAYQDRLYKNLHEENVNSRGDVNRDNWIYLGLMVLAISLLFAIAVWVIREITKGLNSADHMAIAFAKGEFDRPVHIETKDEIADILIHMDKARDSLRQTLKAIGGASVQLAAAAEETSAISAQTDQGVRQQQQETEMVAAAMNEMSATVHDIARNAADASNAAGMANEAAT
ncbi:MAG: methyl-accepting chemotaxis protein, partial [Halothiobacillus sp.]